MFVRKRRRRVVVGGKSGIVVVWFEGVSDYGGIWLVVVVW